MSSSGTIVAGYTNAGGSGSSQLNGPTGVFIDSNRTLYIVDNLNYRIQRWYFSQPIGFTVAGGRGSGSTLDKLSTSRAVYVDNQLRVYVSEYGNHRVTRWASAVTGVIVGYFQIFFS